MNSSLYYTVIPSQEHRRERRKKMNVVGKALARLMMKNENSRYQKGMNTDHTNSKRTKGIDSTRDNFMPRTYIKLTRALKNLNVSYLRRQK